MFHNPFAAYFKNRRLRGIAKQVRSGIVPKDVDREEIYEALRLTKPKNATELFGFLSAVVHNLDGTLKKDYGLVSVREVTSAFALRLVDGLMDSATTMSNFHQHKMGTGSTSETDTHTALVAAQSGAQAVGGATAQTHSTSVIYRSIGTITAITAQGIREHGIFNASTGGILLDRSLVTNIDVNAEDVVTWTYDLTVSAGG